MKHDNLQNGVVARQDILDDFYETYKDKLDQSGVLLEEDMELDVEKVGGSGVLENPLILISSYMNIRRK